MTIRAAVYIDGFNLYHAINDLAEPHLKWVNLWQLSANLIPSRTEILEKVVYCTAYYPKDPKKRIRHESFVNALNLLGVTTILGHYSKEPMDCHGCGHFWERPTEKESDVNLALSLYDDAVNNRFDHAYLVTADSDQAATVAMLRKNYPSKMLTTVCPPGRNFSKAILAHSPFRIMLDRDAIDRAAFDGFIEAPPGKRSIIRPFEYDPPTGWVHPKDRR